MRIEILILMLTCHPAWSAPTRVGNGDEGSDLEGATPITQGKISDTQKKAEDLLNKLNVSGIEGLGTLIPEVGRAPLFQTKTDVQAALPEDQGVFHSNMKGNVFARTFPQAHAATRFFPIAETLEEDQLVALHIHEALHRALPASVREDEGAVSKITLTITAPGANRDQIAQTVEKLVPRDPAVAESVGTQSIAPVEKYPVSENSKLHQPSLIGYAYRSFQKPKRQSLFPVNNMHIIQSFFYPFGNDRNPLGLGIEASFIGRETATQTGPLSLSARMRLWSARGFDIEGWLLGSFNSLSADELKNSPIGRDVGTIGLSARKEFKRMYIENSLSWSTPGTAKESLGQIEYTHSFGSFVNVGIHAGSGIGHLKAGGFVELALADYYRVNGGAFPFDSGRYRIYSGGPEIAWVEKDFSVGLAGRFILNATKDANYDYLGNVMGQGMAQGNLAGNLNFFF